MKKTLMLVGGGVIARHYKTGLENSNTLRTVALVDERKDCAARELFNAPFFTDFKAALKLKPQVALLAIPPAARGEMIKCLLAEGIAVLTEKPLCGSLEEAQELFEAAESAKTPLKCLFHWKAADEVRYLKAHLKHFGEITSIKTRVCDDYAATQSGEIRPDRRVLLGAWYDSGINVLSYYDEILDLSNAVTVGEEQIIDKVSGQCKFVCKKMKFGKTDAEITVDWTTPSREKTSEIICKNGAVSVNHTNQTVTFNGKTVYCNPVSDRLASHYENLFENFELDMQKDSALLLHKILFTGAANEK